MSTFRELIGVAGAGLLAKPVRTMLVALGPMLGVAAILGVVGMSDSTRGELRALLRELGTELIVVSAQPSAGQTGAPRLPQESAARVRRLETVAGVAAATTIDGVAVRPSRHPSDQAMIAPSSVRAVDRELLSVLRMEMDHGRYLSAVGADAAARVAVLGSRLAALYGIVPGEPRTILLDDYLYAVVGVLGESPLVPELDWTVLVSPQAAARDWQHDGRPSTLYIRSVEGRSEATARVLPLAVTYGGPGLPAVSIPSSLLAADAEIDATLRVTALAMGALSLLIGAIGIANVLTISVLQRAGEIGVRRALGHTRLLVAGQFLLEAVAIGLVGGIAGGAIATGLVVAVALYQGWVVVLEPTLVVATVFVAVVVSGLAGIYPALRAARLDPLTALRS